jgi:glycosyltransferase involved in cell wall biosynthesis
MPGTSFSLPKVTIVTPAYNSAKVIEECLRSVAVQTYTNKEHLIIDAQSKDDTLKIVKDIRISAWYPNLIKAFMMP